MNPVTLSWVYLLVAGVLEIVWALAVKYSVGLTKTGPSIAAFVLGFTSFYFLALATERLPIGTAYAIWTGIGAIGTALFGMMLFAEPRTAFRLTCILVIVAGIVGLQLSSK